MTRNGIDWLWQLARSFVHRPKVSVEVIFPLEILATSPRIFASRMRAKPGFDRGMSGVAMMREVFFEPKATVATHMGTSEGKVVFLGVCATIATVSGALPIRKQTRT